MADFEFDFDEFFKGLDFSEKAVRDGATRGMHDVIDDLDRISSDIAPIDKGILAKSSSKDVHWNGNTIVGELTFSVTEKDANGKPFNYALWTHEQVYQYGEGTLDNPPVQGMSGKSYYAGRKYLERPLKGESEAYKKHLADEIRKELNKNV